MSYEQIEELRSAASDGRVQEVTTLLDRSPGIIDGQNWEGTTALHEASYRGHTEVAQLLLDRGADKDIQDIWGETALHWASIGRHTEVAQLLLDRGANKDITNGDGETALHYASQNGDTEVAQLLLDRGANIHIKDIDGKTALDVAKDDAMREVFTGHPARVAAAAAQVAAERAAAEEAAAEEAAAEMAVAAERAFLVAFLGCEPDPVLRPRPTIDDRIFQYGALGSSSKPVVGALHALRMFGNRTDHDSMDDLLPREKPAIVAAAFCVAQAVLGGLASPSPAPPRGGVFMPPGQPGAFPGQQAPRGGMMYPPNMAGGRGGAGMGGAQGRGGRGAPQGVPGAVNGGRGVGGPMMGGVGQQGPRPVYGISSPRMMQQPGMPYGGPRPQFPFPAGGVAPYMQQQGVGPQGMPQMGGPGAYIPSPPYVPHQQQQYEDQDDFSDEDDI